MAKTSRGGKRTNATMILQQGATQPIAPPPAPVPAPQLVMPTPQQIAQGITLPLGGTDYNDFLNMTDDEKADEIAKAMKSSVPVFLDDSALQKMMYYTGYNQKPDVVDDTAYANASGKEIFRTVHDVYDRTTDISYSATEIAKQVQTGAFTQVSGNNSSAHGAAIYFADSVSESAYYVDSSKNNVMMRAKIKPTAKLKTETTVSTEIYNEIGKGTKLGQVLKSVGRVDPKSQIGIYCMAKGYDGWVSKGTGYHMIINRGALVTSKSLKKNVKYGERTW